MTPEVQTGRLAFETAMLEVCCPRIEKATVQIIKPTDDGYGQDRTGVLYSIMGMDFLITAAHEMKWSLMFKELIGLSPTGVIDDAIPFGSSSFTLTTQTDDDPPEYGMDLGIVRLGEDVADHLREKGKEFIRHNQVDLGPVEKRAVLVVCGYPSEWNSRTIDPDHLARKPIFYQTYLDPLAEGIIGDYDPEMHMTLKHDLDLKERHSGAPLPHLGGISGGGIWQVGFQKHGIPYAKDADSLTLVGIEHGVLRKSHLPKRIKGTKIQYAMHVISTQYPETVDAMKLIYPKN